MKKIFFVAAILCGVWAGSRNLATDSASAQPGTTGTFTRPVTTPLTNQLTFTNTLVSPTNALSLQLNGLVTLLLKLQTNVELTIPALNLIESNSAAPPAAAPANNFGRPNVFRGQFGSLTSIPPPLTGRRLIPTGAASGTATPQTATNEISITIGTNTFQLNPATLNAIVTLRDNLERILPALQQLNGTAPQPTNNNAPGASFLNPPVANFMPLPDTNGFTAPLTNTMQSPF